MSPAADRADFDDEYEVLRRLGAGGMGEVFLANKLGLDGRPLKLVVIKRILPHLADTPDRVRRFLDEMAVAARLDHRNVVRVSGWGQDRDGSYYIEMELVRGMSLDELLEHRAPEGRQYGALPPADVAWIGMQACLGLQYAHTHVHGDATGVLHRDISTDNLMIDVDGDVRIADWGIAKALKGADRLASETDHAYGKSYYMPPEQWRGDELDARADLYALGVTLVNALSGRQLYEAGPNDTLPTLMLRVFKAERPTVAEMAPHAPAQMQQLLEAMLAVDRDYRPRTAGELVGPFKELAKQLGGDLHEAQRDLAERIAEHYAQGAPTERSMPAMPRPDAHASSNQRPISPATQQASPSPSSTQPPVQSERRLKTTPLGGPAEAAPVQTPAAAAPPSPSPAPSTSSARPLLVGAIVAGVLVLGVLTGAALLVFGRDWTASGDPRDTEVTAPQLPSAPAAPPSPVPTTPATEPAPVPPTDPGTEAPATEAPTATTAEPSADPPTPVIAETTEAGPPSGARPHRRARRRTPTAAPAPEVRPLAPQSTPAPQQRATSRTPGLSDLLGN